MSASASTTPGRITVLIVDDHPLLRDGLRFIFGLNPDLELVGEAEDGQRGLQLIEELAPAVILLDLQMPLMEGLAFLEAFRDRGLRGRVIVLTTFCREREIQRVMELDAWGYVLKDSPREIVCEAVREVASGRRYFQGPVLARAREHAFEKPLTPREAQVLERAWRGLLNKEIADQFGISEGTVKIHLNNTYRKLGAANRPEAIREALRRGLLRADD